jgi:hypothetical protein
MMKTLTDLGMFRTLGAPLPKEFEHEGRVYHIAGGSLPSLADIATGKVETAYINYMTTMETDLSLSPFLATAGDERKTRDLAAQVYESLTRRPSEVDEKPQQPPS